MLLINTLWIFVTRIAVVFVISRIAVIFVISRIAVVFVVARIAVVFVVAVVVGGEACPMGLCRRSV